jgi:hypothetical protein
MDRIIGCRETHCRPIKTPAILRGFLRGGGIGLRKRPIIQLEILIRDNG